MNTDNPREAAYPIDRLFLDRWSPRSFTGEEMPHSDLLVLFEAARWAPSCANSQPWRFLYAHRDAPNWAIFLGLLSDSNRSWAKNASVLTIVVSKKTIYRPADDSEAPSPSHSFDAGAAWANLALQAELSGWAAHAMAGFDKVRAASELNVPENFRIEAAIAIGRRGDRSKLPDVLQEREQPNGRNAVETFAFEGGFPTA